MNVIKNRERFYNGTFWNGSQMDYFEELLKSDDYMDHIVVARMGYALDRLISHENPEVRRAVALAGYGLDELARDPDEGVRKAVAENAAIVKLLPDIVDALLEGGDFGVKTTLARNGYCTNLFATDENEHLRFVVAQSGYDPEKMSRDDSALVRHGVAQALPIIKEQNPKLAEEIGARLLNDFDIIVRWAAQEAITGGLSIGQKIVDDDGFRGEVTAIHPSGMVKVSHEVVNGQKVAADGWYPPERLKPFLPDKVDELISRANVQSDETKKPGLGRLFRSLGIEKND